MCSKNIVDLNTCCFEVIFKYLDVNDHIAVAHTNVFLRNMFFDLIPHLYPFLDSDDPKFKIFPVIYKKLKDLLLDGDCLNINEIIDKNLLEKFQEMESLEILRFSPNDDVPEMGLILLQFVNLPKLTEILFPIRDEGYEMDLSELGNFRNLEKLIAPLDTQQIIQILKNNPNLKSLKIPVEFPYTDIAAILPYANNLERLEVYSSKDIELLAKLPKLRQLRFPKALGFTGNPRIFEQFANQELQLLEHLAIGSNPTIFELFANQEPQQLEYLSIGEGPIYLEEAKQLVRIKTLKDLQCLMINEQGLELLTELKSLEYLRIGCWAKSDVTGIMLRIMESCKNLRELDILNARVSKDLPILASNVLKKVRNPIDQKPLLLKVGNRGVNRSIFCRKEIPHYKSGNKYLKFETLPYGGAETIAYEDVPADETLG